MRNNKLKIIISIFLIFIFLSNIVVSSYSNHVHHCYEENCKECALIQNIQNFIKNLTIAEIVILAIFFNFPKIKNIGLNTKGILLSTLVGSKVQFNE